MIEVVPFAGALSYPGKHRQAAVLLGDVIDKLHHVYGFAHAGAAEQADLAALGKRTYQINHLDAGFQQINRRGQFVKFWCLLMDGAALVAWNVTLFINRATQHIHNTTQRAVTDRHGNGIAGIIYQHAATQAVG